MLLLRDPQLKDRLGNIMVCPCSPPSSDQIMCDFGLFSNSQRSCRVNIRNEFRTSRQLRQSDSETFTEEHFQNFAESGQWNKFVPRGEQYFQGDEYNVSFTVINS